MLRWIPLLTKLWVIYGSILTECQGQETLENVTRQGNLNEIGSKLVSCKQSGNGVVDVQTLECSSNGDWEISSTVNSELLAYFKKYTPNNVQMVTYEIICATKHLCVCYTNMELKF
jgi:hypothetical protein